MPDTPQTRAPAYELAFSDQDFLCREELRPVRLQLELLKPGMLMDEYGVESTVVMFGGARIPSPQNKGSARTETLADLSKFYAEARKFAELMTAGSPETDEDVIVNRRWTGRDGGGQPGRGWMLAACRLASISYCRTSRRRMNM